MPELPEVETTRRGILPHVRLRQVAQVVVRNPCLRWPVPEALAQTLADQTFLDVQRRAKYLLLPTDAGTLILHLGMSGSLRILPEDTPALKHDHLDIQLDSGQLLRLTDPRRFGAALWTTDDIGQHPLIRSLGPEPLSEAFSGDNLFERSRGRKQAIKTFIMDNHTVVGVGNIYANESLFMAGIRPDRPAGKISRERYQRLAEAIQDVLSRAIERGGTTLRDFCRRRWQARLLQRRTGHLRPLWPALLALRRKNSGNTPWQPGILLLPALPALEIGFPSIPGNSLAIGWSKLVNMMVVEGQVCGNWFFR